MNELSLPQQGLGELLKTLQMGSDLSSGECDLALEKIIKQPEAPQSIAFLVLLLQKGETVEELTAFVKFFQKHMKVLSVDIPVLDIVGTGGDGYHTLNISTGASLLAAGCGIPVVKHGNRAVSSTCGSADVLEKLGIKINIAPQQVKQSLEHTNFGFCYAPNFHPIFGKLKKVRKLLGLPTTFNLLGPLLNPAQAKHMMVGVKDKNLVKPMAQLLVERGCDHSLVFYGQGLDEISTLGPIEACEIKDGKIKKLILDPKDFGFSYCKLQDLQGGDVSTNAERLTDVLQGKASPFADTLIFNVGVACYLYGLTQTIEEGIILAKEKHQGGEGMKVLLNVRKVTNHVE